MGFFSISFLIIFLISILVAIFILASYNSLVKLRVNTDNAWSQIDVQLKRRYDLIPNLVETVKGYVKHEKGTLEAVIQARNMAMSSSASKGGAAEVAAAENMLSSTLKSIFALSEAYPELKANENFQSLQEEITTTENKVSFARQHYNDSVSRYMTQMEVFPSNLIANAFNFENREFFELDESEFKKVQKTPDVSF